jgi:thymidine phosphorylase
VAGQTADLVPADGALYALRDATATVSSVPLIAASVMSKKLAVGTDLILLDVKAGSGAFMKTADDAADLARACVRLAELWHRPARAAVTDMSQPLGTAVGNALDVAECVEVLKAERGGRLRELSVAFAAEALAALGLRGREEGVAEASRALDDGRAAGAFAAMVQAQGGDARVVDDPWSVLPRAPRRTDVSLGRSGWVRSIDAEGVGRAAVHLGAGRLRKGDPIDPAVGVEFLLSIGDRVDAADTAAVIHHRDGDAADRAAVSIRAAVDLAEEPAIPPPLVVEWVGRAGPGGPEGAG